MTSMTPSSEPIRELHSITDLSSDEKEDQFDREISKVCDIILLFSLHLGGTKPHMYASIGNIGFPDGPSFRYGNFFTSKN